jgi:ribosome maturation factor RimP
LHIATVPEHLDKGRDARGRRHAPLGQIWCICLSWEEQTTSRQHHSEEDAMAAQPVSDEILAAIRPAIGGAGLDLEDVELVAAGRRRILRVLVDKDGGVGLDDIAQLTQRVSSSLDSTDAMGEQPYTLEVTSPGVDRPLTAPRHWRRNIGRLVKVTGHDGSVRVGRIIEASDAQATVETSGSAQPVSYADVAKARVEIEFQRRDSGKD